MTTEQLKIVEETTLYSSTKAIETAIETAGANASTLQIEYQKIACSIVLHLGKNSDIRVYNRLIESMPDLLRVDSMQAFFDKYSVIAFDDEGNASINKKKGTKLGEALCNPWWKAKKAQPYVPYNFLERCKVLLQAAQNKAKKADKEKEAGKKPVDSVTWAQVNALSGLIRSLESQESAQPEQAEAVEKIAA